MDDTGGGPSTAARDAERDVGGGPLSAARAKANDGEQAAASDGPPLPPKANKLKSKTVFPGTRVLDFQSLVC